MEQNLETKQEPMCEIINSKENKELEQIKGKEIHKQEIEGEISFPSLQKTLTLNFDNQRIYKIKELSNKRIGILLNHSFQIYNLNSFKKIEEIKLPVSDNYYSDERISDFTELKNSDLVLWSLKKIFFYQLSENHYSLYQSLNGLEEIKENKENKENKEKEEEEDEDDYYEESYYYHRESKEFEINSIYELTNGKLVCCSSTGLIIYIKDNEKYIFESKHKMKIDVRKIIEYDTNKLILLQRYHYFFWGCSRNNFFSHTYSISTYDIETKKLTELASNKVTKNDFYGYCLISYMIKDGKFLVRYGNRIDIYDIKNNMLLLNHDQNDMIKNENNYYGNYKILKDEMDIIFLCDYDDNLIITKNKENKVRIYTLKDNTLKYVKDFPFEQEDLNEIIKLKNGTLLMYSRNELSLLNKK